MNRQKRWMALLACALVLTGCKNASKKQEAPDEEIRSESIQQDVASDTESVKPDEPESKEQEPEEESAPSLAAIEEAEEAASAPASQADWQALYTQKLSSAIAMGNYGASEAEYAPLWYLWQRADSSAPVLVLLTGVSEAEKMLEFYGVSNGEVIFLGESGAAQSAFYSGESPDSFTRVWMHHGAEMVYEGVVQLTTNGVSETLISQNDYAVTPTVPSGEEWIFQNRYAWPYASMQ